MAGTVHADVEQVLDGLGQDRAREALVYRDRRLTAGDVLDRVHRLAHTLDGRVGPVHAAVVARDDTVTAAGLTALVEQQRGTMYAPRKIAFVDELPLTDVGKTDKKALRAARPGVISARRRRAAGSPRTARPHRRWPR